MTKPALFLFCEFNLPWKRLGRKGRNRPGAGGGGGNPAGIDAFDNKSAAGQGSDAGDDPDAVLAIFISRMASDPGTLAEW